MISKLNINGKSYVYGNANEKTLWLEFKAEINAAKFDKWLYNSGIKDRPADLGYFIGYKICEAYYKKALELDPKMDLAKQGLQNLQKLKSEN